MPSTRIETGAGWIGHRHQDVIDAVQTALQDALHIPDWDRDVVLTEHPLDKRIIPCGRSERFTRIEIVMFAGRSPAAKRALYGAICDNFEALGVPRNEVKIVLIETPRENWGIRGGQSAADIDLGFEIAV
jgi:phenylpyruvate tautomerase PptA (4-oxalocrotonate tautomerase family)